MKNGMWANTAEQTAKHLRSKPTKQYSVLLLYPDYLAENFGGETYFAHVEAELPAEAIKLAQYEAGKEKGVDFHPLLVIEGHHDDLRP